MWVIIVYCEIYESFKRQQIIVKRMEVNMTQSIWNSKYKNQWFYFSSSSHQQCYFIVTFFFYYYLLLYNVIFGSISAISCMVWNINKYVNWTRN